MDPCPTCPRLYRPIPGDGPQPCPILGIAERPGKDENKYGRVLIGKTGEELNQTYLPSANLERSGIRLCNAVLCWADNNRTPTPAEVRSCANHHLPTELGATKPEVLVLMGGSACVLIPELRLDTQHGIPVRSSLRLGLGLGSFHWSGWVVPMFHPALGLHESRWMTMILEDWERLGRFLSGSYTHPSPNLVTSYKLVQDSKELHTYDFGQEISIDTETHGAVPYSIQCSPLPGVAFMVLASNGGVVRSLTERLRGMRAILHNAPHDLDELEKMGIFFREVRDTMQEAYQLGNLPQGLKPLVYRLFGFTMTSWEDVVRPASINALLEWLGEALVIANADLSLIEVKQLKTKTKEIVKRGPLEQLVSRLIAFTDIRSDYDPWERLDTFWELPDNEQMTSHVESRIGRYPILGIGNAQLDRAVEYGCGDADWTGQVAVELERRRNSDYWEINEEDRDS